MRLFIVLFLVASMAHSEASETWTCMDDSSSREGALWTACGVGEGIGEREARDQALRSAINEFGTICAISSDCDGHKRTVEPKRITCTHYKSGLWKCYRMIQITLF